MKLKNLGIRLLFVAWAVPLGIVVILSDFDLTSLLPAETDWLKPITPLSAITLLIPLLAAVEYIEMLSTRFQRNRFHLVLIWFIPAFLNFFLAAPLFDTIDLILMGIIPIAVETALFGKGSQRWNRASLAFTGFIILFLAGQQMLNYQSPEFLSLWRQDIPGSNRTGIIITLSAIFMCDSAAFFAGNFFGKHPLSSISPKKTIEGSIGGFAASIAVMIGGALLFGSPRLPLWLAAVLGAAIGIAGQVGDLTASLIKRYFNVKDSSNLIPGHGGIIDRFDSLLFATPVIHLIVKLNS
ncbi:MAG: phosphatidate cytidylyltransferase [Fibrobacterota bacterium]